MVGLSRSFYLLRLIPCVPPLTPNFEKVGLGSFHFARRYYGNRFFFLFLELLRCFSSLRSPPVPMYSVQDTGSSTSEFPHSDI